MHINICPSFIADSTIMVVKKVISFIVIEIIKNEITLGDAAAAQLICEEEEARVCDLSTVYEFVLCVGLSDEGPGGRETFCNGHCHSNAPRAAPRYGGGSIARNSSNALRAVAAYARSSAGSSSALSK